MPQYYAFRRAESNVFNFVLSGIDISAFIRTMSAVLFSGSNFSFSNPIKWPHEPFGEIEVIEI